MYDVSKKRHVDRCVNVPICGDQGETEVLQVITVCMLRI